MIGTILNNSNCFLNFEENGLSVKAFVVSVISDFNRAIGFWLSFESA